MNGIFSKRRVVEKIKPKPEIPAIPQEKIQEVKPKKERGDKLVLYEIIYSNMKDLRKKEITTKEFRDLLRYFRVPTALWFVIMKDMERLYGIKCNCKRITIKGG